MALLVLRRNAKSISHCLKSVVAYMLLSCGSVVMLMPLFWSVTTSLKFDGQEMSLPPVWIPNPVNWENYPRALVSAPFDLYFTNTMIILVTATIGTVLTAAMAAYAFARLRWRGRNYLFSICLGTMMIPSAITLIPTFIMFSKIGWIDTFLPLTVPYWFGGGAFYIFLLRQFFLTIPIELEEAAKVDGAGYLRIFWQIILPLATPALATIVIFSTIYHWNDYLTPLIYLNSESKRTLALGLYGFLGEYVLHWNMLMAAANIMTLPILVVFFVAQRFFVKGIALTGISGR